MMALNTTVYEKFRNAFEQKCCQLIVEAYQTALNEKVIQLDWNENDISYELYEKMEANPKRISLFKIHLSPEFRIPKDVPKLKSFSDKLPRIDLKMAHFALKQEFKYFFEAKRLKEKSSHLKRAYINEGMDRYISEKYPLGCMLGYLLEGKTNETIKGINSLLEKDKRDTEVLSLKSEKVLKSIYQSKHSDIGTLKHLIFNFTNIAN
ncbi:hypothetical protein [Chryseobacterium rhizosphaerae]|uniref:hypothetical protein n=1 Tax=Chryseobacterium rhizosphaerae TaxID=395937 RepID=UPI0023597B17|nr:hypothetical protein [Chryseobacterium rhizosphaerae]MDC8098438.1 hypothetical protein [Chryseobacterium rhizosphaerae]